MPSCSPLLNFLADRKTAANLDPAAWSLLFAESRSCGLMSRVAAELDGVLPSMPPRLLPHVLAATRQARSLEHDVKGELRLVAAALEPVKTKIVLLKGAAYVAAGLPAARGRIFSDIDLLVDAQVLAQTEGALTLAGWLAQRLPAYDERWYREWSHEVPPMVHFRRDTTIDLHHSLAMPTCRIRIDARRMIEDAIAIPGDDNWFRLKDEDLVLHAASHLLLNSVFDRGLRDLWDIDILLRHFGGAVPDFADRVLVRAEQVGLGAIAHRALALCHHFFRTPLPEGARMAGGFVARLLVSAASTRHPDTRPRGQGAADALLFVRELSLRLPPHLLLRHLWHKAGVALRPQEKLA